MDHPPPPNPFEALGPSLRTAPLGTAILRSHVDRTPYQRLYLAMTLLLAVLALSFLRDEHLPDASQLDPLIAGEPVQAATSAAPFDKSVDGEVYHIVPVATYDISALVVSEHDSRTWWDMVHKEAGDFLNVTDLCVVWGQDTTDSVYKQVSFANSEFTCEWTSPADGIHSMQTDGVSNNHLLTENRFTARDLRDVRIGDQIRLRGYLVNYANQRSPGAYRNSSLVRSDVGDGACEVIYVTQLTILHAGTRVWHLLKFACALGLLGCALIWLALPYRGKP